MTSSSSTLLLRPLRRSPYFWMWLCLTGACLWGWSWASSHAGGGLFHTAKGSIGVAVMPSFILVSGVPAIPHGEFSSIRGVTRVPAAAREYFSPLRISWSQPDPSLPPFASKELHLELPLWLVTAFPLTGLATQLLLRSRWRRKAAKM